MADAQILAGGDHVAPLAYTIPGAQEIIVKAGFATFDGAAAGGAFLPCMRVLAPGGKVVGEYITDESVAAGSSAEVSFAPFLRAGGGGGAATATADYATAQRDITTALFADGFTNSYPADYFDVGNTAMYGDDGTGKLEILEAGLHELTMTVALQSTTEPASNHPTINQQFSAGGFPNDHTLTDPGNFYGTNGITIAGTTYWNVYQVSWLDLNTAPCSVWMVITGGGAAHTHYDDAQASIRAVRLTEASPSGVS